MKKIFYLLLFFALGCSAKKQEQSFDEVDYLLTKEWIYTHTVNDLKNNGEKISRPPGVEQLIMRLEIIQPGGKSFKNHCVYYRVPYKKNAGTFKVAELKQAETCPEISPDEVIVMLDGITEFSVHFKNFKVLLSFSAGKTKREMSIPLLNVEEGLLHEKYSPLQEKRLYDGMRLLRLNEESFDYASNRYLGKIADRFGQGTAIRCHQVSKDCEDIGENRCDDCRYGWFEVVDYQCPQGGSKFCGQNHCGEKNEPACPRGIKVVDQDEAGICQSDLEPVLNADKILVCQ